MKTKKKVVVIGGGTGTYSVLSGLKAYSDEVSITAIVAMSDNGSSAGRLRDEFGALPVGDVRMALLALSDDTRIDNASLRALFSYRYVKGGEGLNGHNFGNLLLVALGEILGSQHSAIEMVSRLLNTQGVVLPVTTDSISLVATYDDGLRIVGESSIDEPPEDRGNHKIINLTVEPRGVLAHGVREALLEADYIILGPGDLYTSLLAAVVVGDLAHVLAQSKGTFIYIANLMSKFGQTTGYDTATYISEIKKYAGRVPDYVFINTHPLSEELIAKYAVTHEYPVHDGGRGSHDTVCVKGDFISTEEVRTARGDTIRRSLIRHDAEKISSALRALWLGNTPKV